MYVLVYSNSCIHCKRFMPTWYVVKARNRFSTFKEFEINSNEGRELMMRYRITGVPTIIIGNKTCSVEEFMRLGL